MLKSLEISGFKSFAKKGELEFNSPISAIVGPNGSGKSNIAEAFRFVLGEQSLKSMRGKRGEDLIFAGSRNERAMNRACVKVVFDNSNRFLNIDFDDVIIERVVHRDGANQYFINKSQVRLKDVIELLAGANIGASGHHIISQGEADRILSVNSKERREMVEEAFGLRVYQFKISESEKKLVKVEENIKSVQSLRREIAPHLRFLSKQVKKIEESVELRKKLKELYKGYFKREDGYLKYQKDYIEKNKKPLREEMAVLDRELDEAKKMLSQTGEEKKENRDFLNLENKIQEIRSRKSELSRKIGQLEGMISFEERRIQRELDNQKKEDEKVIKFKEVKNFLSSLNSQLDNSQGLVLSDFVNKIKQAISEFISSNSQSACLENGSNNEIDNSELDKLTKEKEEVEKQLFVIAGEENEIVEKRNQLKMEIEQEKSSWQKAEVRVFEINAKQSEIKSKLNTLNDLENRVVIEDENFKRELNEAFVLAGRDSVQFSSFEISLDEIIGENRNKQEERRRELEKIKIRLEDMGGGSGEDVVKEFNETQERDEFLLKEIEDLEKSSASLNELIVELKEKLNNEFKDGINKINKQFQEFFALMFGGGRAELLIVKIKKRKKLDTDLSLNLDDDGVESSDGEEENGEEGIDVSVSLPNKKTKGLQMLSGGERSLTSIALLFAMSQIKPPPFIILDETDAALDEANSRRYGDMIDNLSEYSQLILITHNRETMSRAGVLYGITMSGDGVSRLLSVKLDEAVKVAK
ncbi:AAA family ATPase [Patescibacteria group bacterium]|nr:AAA family ATPase [Patescibacteria group bacterium]MCG2694831.1 AAA family ATPase [Candidatus Parcubacteria bacterium]